jgi:hypothetical protein
MTDVTVLLSLMKVVLSRGMLFAIGFAAGCFTMLFIWLLFKVLPKISTYVSLIDSYDRFLKEEKGYRIRLDWLLFVVIFMLFCIFLVIYALIR